MRFPSELIDLIVSKGLDSCRTSISWSHISPHFKNLITKQLGLVVLHDGTQGSDEAEPLLDYRVLMVEGNTLHFETNHPEYETLKQFIAKFSSLLIVIHSDKSYNDVLAGILNDVAQFSVPGTSLCVVYSNSLNFLSKLYFRELSLYQDKIRLCELHVLGNGEASVDEVCDLNTLFERTYLYNLKSIYSLDVQSSQHLLISKDLLTIKQLNFVAYDEASSEFFRQCPSLKVIESMKYPIKDQDTPYRLPRCDAITLTHYVSGCHYAPIDGSTVGEELTLVPSLRSADPEFHGLHFPRLKRLFVKLNDAVSHQVRFRDCNFKSLALLTSGSCIIPWDDLLSAGWSSGALAVTLTSEEQLQWLNSAPMGIDILKIQTPQVRFTEFPSSSLFETSKLHFSTIVLHLSIVWQCYLLQNLILPKLRPDDTLRVKFDENALSESLASNLNRLRALEIEDDCVSFKIPTIRHFELLEVGSRSRYLRAASLSNSLPTDATTSSPLNNIDSIFFDASANHEMCYAVSPSEFRRNSLAGLTNESARRQSAIVFPSGPRTRRASSISSSNFSPPAPTAVEDPFDGDTAVFEFVEYPPKVLTTNLKALESSSFSWKSIKSNRVPVLRIVVLNQDFEIKVDNLDTIVETLIPRIIEVLKFPYDVRLPTVLIDKFQAVIDLVDLNITVSTEQWQKVSTDMQAYLAFKGYKVPVLIDQSETNLKVSVLLKVS